MLITRSQSVKDARRAAAERETMTDLDLLSIAPIIGGVDYASPTAFDEVVPGDFKVISGIPWFTSQAVSADAGNEYSALDSYD